MDVGFRVVPEGFALERIDGITRRVQPLGRDAVGIPTLHSHGSVHDNLIKIRVDDLAVGQKQPFFPGRAVGDEEHRTANTSENKPHPSE